MMFFLSSSVWRVVDQHVAAAVIDGRDAGLEDADDFGDSAAAGRAGGDRDAVVDPRADTSARCPGRGRCRRRCVFRRLKAPCVTLSPIVVTFTCCIRLDAVNLKRVGLRAVGGDRVAVDDRRGGEDMPGMRRICAIRPSGFLIFFDLARAASRLRQPAARSGSCKFVCRIGVSVSRGSSCTVMWPVDSTVSMMNLSVNPCIIAVIAMNIMTLIVTPAMQTSVWRRCERR